MPSWRLCRVVWRKAIWITGGEVSTLECRCLHLHQASKQCRVQGSGDWWDRKSQPSSYSDKLPSTRDSGKIKNLNSFSSITMKPVLLQDAFTVPVGLLSKRERMFKGISWSTLENPQKFVKVCHMNLHYRRMWKNWISLMGCFCDFLLSDS